MDILSIIGLLLAVVAIVGGNYLEGGHIGALINGPAALIVVGGTLGAVFIQTPLAVFKRSLAIFGWVFSSPRIALHEGIGKVVNWSDIARKEGLLGLEPLAEMETDLFARKGLQLLADGCETETLRGILEVELVSRENRDLRAARVYESMGGYSPTIGIIGAVMGLIHVMGNLADPAMLGSGIAVAFVATIYGVALSNLFLLPVAAKLKAVVQERSRYQEMLLEGLTSIAEGENPRSIELKLEGFLD